MPSAQGISATTSWDPMKELDLTNPDAMTSYCVGIARSYRPPRRCQNTIAHHNISAAKEVLIQLTRPNIGEAKVRELLEKLAGHTLCRTYHQNQVKEVAERWMVKFKPNIAGNVEPGAACTSSQAGGNFGWAEAERQLSEALDKMRQMQSDLDDLLRRTRSSEARPSDSNGGAPDSDSSSSTSSSFGSASSSRASSASSRSSISPLPTPRGPCSASRSDQSDIGDERQTSQAQEAARLQAEEERKRQAEQARRDQLRAEEARRQAKESQQREEARVREELRRAGEARREEARKQAAREREEREAEARARAERERIRREKAEEARLRREREARERREREVREWQEAWANYERLWTALATLRSNITHAADLLTALPWPTKRGSFGSCDEASVTDFFKHAPGNVVVEDKPAFRKAMKKQATRWHPDRVVRMVPAMRDRSDIMTVVTLISQVANGMKDESKAWEPSDSL